VCDRLSWRAIAAPGAKAILRLWKPFVVIQFCGLAVVLAYFHVPAFNAFCGHLATLKAQGGFLFSAVVMSVASGFVPELMKYLTGVDRVVDRRRWRNIAFAMALFAVSGVFCDAFYRLLTIVFGDNNRPLTVLAKVACDQFAFTPTFGLGTIALAYAWRAERYSLKALYHNASLRWYIRIVGRLAVPCWIYWIPMASLMYVLPSSLTFVFGATAAAASSLIFIAVASGEKG